MFFALNQHTDYTVIFTLHTDLTNLINLQCKRTVNIEFLLHDIFFYTEKATIWLLADCCFSVFDPTFIDIHKVSWAAD